MKKYVIACAALATISLAGPTHAAEGANTGSATSTPAGPAGDNQGPSKMSNPSTGQGAMKGDSGGTATGAGENKSTATGGQPGGAAGRN